MDNETNDIEAIEDVDWENRVLCSDESCIGVIGADGRCKECGKDYAGELPAAAAPDPEPPPAAASDAAPASDTQRLGALAPESADDDDWAKRVLCSDESCIGVIGPDGCCKECGKPQEG